MSNKIIRQTKPNTIVRYINPDGYLSDRFRHYERVLYLGEVSNSPGYGVFVNDDGVTIWEYPIDNFVVEE